MSRLLLGGDRRGRSAAFFVTSAALASLAFGCASEESGSSDDSDLLAAQESVDCDAGLGKPDATAPRPDASTPRADASTPGTSSSWCAAKEILDDKCGSCHGAETAGGAPMPLATYEDFLAAAPITTGKKVFEVVQSRVHDARRPMPPGRPLDPADMAVIDKWVAEGAKGGECSGHGHPGDGEPPKEPAVWPPVGSDKCYRVTVDNDGKGAKQQVAAGTEPHPQVILDAPWGNQDVQALGFRPITDNKKILHHWILYQNSGGMAFVTGWSPGQDESELDALPPDVGLYLPKGPRSLRLDMHYYNKQGTKTEADGSGVEICVTTKPRKHAATTFMGFAGIPIIEPGQTKDIVGTCNVKVTQPVYLLNESPHAHQFATHMKFQVKRGNEIITLRDAPFNFEEQTSKNLPKPFELKNGDQVITTCTYKNDTNKRITFGENTGNEMCFNFATYYPKGALSCGGLLGGLFGL